MNSVLAPVELEVVTEHLEIGGWKAQKRDSSWRHIWVLFNSKMLIAEISRMYALIDGKIATMKVRETGAAGVERLEILLCPIIYGCDHFGLKITAGNFGNDNHLLHRLLPPECITAIAMRSSGHAATGPCTLVTDQENIKPKQKYSLLSISLSFPPSLSLFPLIAPNSHMRTLKLT